MNICINAHKLLSDYAMDSVVTKEHVSLDTITPVSLFQVVNFSFI